MKRMVCAWAGVLALWGVGRIEAAPRVEADPNKDYAITPEAGPWMILAASYTGPNAVRQAHELVYQIRRRDNLPAYFFDYSAEERRQLQNYVGPGRRGTVRIQNQCGVLIGGYPDMESAKRALADVKKLKPPDDESLMDRFTVRGPSQTDQRVGEVRGTFLNPFVTSFVTRNPTVPHDQVDKTKDPLLKVLNADEKFSLLNCQHPWTLAVKEYAGLSVVESATTSSSGSFWQKLGLGGKSTDVLSATGQQAHKLAELLREVQPPFESYVLHTRKSSVITVGGFDGPNDPRMREVAEKLEHLRLAQLKRFGQDPLQLFAQPIPMQVPRP
jgi:hypothetical protein